MMKNVDDLALGDDQIIKLNTACHGFTGYNLTYNIIVLSENGIFHKQDERLRN